jgi:hypothetical protein
VHESLECTIDLVRNLRFFEPSSRILIYDGSGGKMRRHRRALEAEGAELHPSPRKLRWGRLHDYVFDCLEYVLDRYRLDTMSFVDSDQLLAKRGYARALREVVDEHPAAGLLTTRTVGGAFPRRLAEKERELWEPLLARLPAAAERFPYWGFWPGTALTGPAGKAILELRGDPALTDILEGTDIEATEEILFPTVATLLGFEVVATPWNNTWVRWNDPLSAADVAGALGQHECYWLHPVEREIDNPARAYLRRVSHGDRGFTPWTAMH